MATLNRRDLLKATAVLGGAVIASSALMAACGGGGAERAAPGDTSSLGAEDQALLEEVADTILPTTAASPGAKAAQAGRVMVLLLAECRGPGDATRVRDGLAALRQRCIDQHGKAFTSLSPSEREKLLVDVNAESERGGETHWFHLLRELSEQAYFSTETGMTRALRYIRVPGHWTGCLPLAPNQPAWG